MINLTFTTSLCDLVLLCGKKQTPDGYKASLTWEWTVRPMNLNSAELLLNWLLCATTPDGKCLFLSLSAIKTCALSLKTVSRMLKCIQTPIPGWRSNIVCTLSGCKATKKLCKVFSFLYGSWNCLPCKSILTWCHENIGNMFGSNQLNLLKFQDWITKSA